MRWIRLYTDVLTGSTLSELSPAERWVWIGLLLLAGDSPVPGTIFLRRDADQECVGFSQRTLAELLKVDLRTLASAVARMERSGKIAVDGKGVISICSWHRYQSEYHRQRPYRTAHPVDNYVDNSTKPVENSAKPVDNYVDNSGNKRKLGAKMHRVAAENVSTPPPSMHRDAHILGLRTRTDGPVRSSSAPQKVAAASDTHPPTSTSPCKDSCVEKSMTYATDGADSAVTSVVTPAVTSVVTPAVTSLVTPAVTKVTRQTKTKREIERLLLLDSNNVAQTNNQQFVSRPVPDRQAQTERTGLETHRSASSNGCAMDSIAEQRGGSGNG